MILYKLQNIKHQKSRNYYLHQDHFICYFLCTPRGIEKPVKTSDECKPLFPPSVLKIIPRTYLSFWDQITSRICDRVYSAIRTTRYKKEKAKMWYNK